MGMSLSLANAIMSVAVSWVSTKSAPFGMLIARKQYQQLDRTFFRALWQSSAVSALGALAAWLGTIFLNVQHFRFAQRLLDPSSIALLMIYMITNVLVFAEAYYLRAHKQEVFFVNSLVGAIGVTCCTFIFGRTYGAKGIVLSCCIGNLLGLAWATQKFLNYRRLWHSAGNSTYVS
jgi:hypothetical protein